MDKNGDVPKTFVSTFRLALRRCERKQNGLETSGRKITGNNKLGLSSATGVKQVKVQSVEAPRFKEPLQNCLVCDGGDAMFCGVITGSEPMRVSWLHNGVATLSLTQCSHGKAGVYTCTAENSAGKTSSSGLLQITGPATKETSRTSSCDTFKETSHQNNKLPSNAEGQSQHREEKGVRGTNLQANISPTKKGPPVSFLNPPEKIEARVGEQTRLHCEFKSASLPVACCWIYNKRKVVAGGPRISVQGTRTQSSVEISQAVPEDAGLYTVVVQNRHGSAQHTVSLSVVDRPTPPSSQPIVSRLSTQSLVLSWTGPSYDGGTAILGYIVEVCREVPNKPEGWTEISRCKNTSFHIHSGLEPLGQYRFRVRAYNPVGISEPSQESDSVKMATGKEKKQEPESYITVTIDTKHKVRDHYNVHEKLGVGKFGEVYRLTHKETGQEGAAKFYRARTSKDKSVARQEIQLMNKLHHPKIVQCLAAYETRSEMAMIMEYIAGGELFERIVDDHFEHTEPTSARYMKQILEGMQYVHQQNIIHLDLKPENIVCVDHRGTQIKIIDFGLAMELEKGKPVLVMHGTPEFVAPEVVNYEPVGLETDMWSIGVICFILLSGESPFQGNNEAETLALVTAAEFEFDPESFEDISDEAKDFISSLLKKDRRARLSCTAALAHSWMASFTPLTYRPSKSLRKDKMKRFLARRKWKKTGQAVLALKRFANLSNRPDSPGCSFEEPGWSQEAEEAIRSLDKQLQTEPRFQEALKDVSLPKGATAELSCRVDGYPQPEVQWLHDDQPLSDPSRVSVQQLEDGLCSLVLADLTPSDSGVYVCRAKNTLGEATCSAKLKVKL
ncbi:myosin light chain kinase, smooth muscle isoform X2 [Austrofundulus limnaeus]|uniref:Myosin light chain kinase, smooth muscle isoform X2 n=1 Tax=Austrofundulus limnaeus TaxID=52670 RepID=A0A2I4B5U6_AUSLI|nr:PREDICTED: myosin light chain kinase, smooth muscle-like isoform X2 [Austrofundulus limnaeus]